MESYSKLVSICPFLFYIYLWLNIRVSKYNNPAKFTADDVKMLTAQVPEVDSCTRWTIYTAHSQLNSLRFGTQAKTNRDTLHS